MGYELNRLMKQYGVSSFSLPQYSGVKAPSDTLIPNAKAKSDVLLNLDSKPTNKYYTAPVAPTTPVMPAVPTVFTGTMPTAPAPLPKKGATAEQTAEYKVSNAQYLADLNKFKADQASAKTAQTTYDASLKSYPDLMKTYNTDLTKFNTDKTTWDELQRKYDLDQKSYNDYVTDYKARMSNAPQRLGSEFVQGKSLMQSRPNTSMGQTTLPENNLIPITQPALNSTDINSWVKQNPYANNQVMQDYQKTNNLTNQDLYNATGSYYGNQLNAPTYGNLSSNFNNLTPQQQAASYAQQLNTGYTDADIKGKFEKQFGSPTDESWTYMQNLAAIPVDTMTPTTTDMSNQLQKRSGKEFQSKATGSVYNAWDPEYYTSRPDLYTPLAKGGSVHHLARKYAVGGGIVSDVMPNPEEGVPQPAPQMQTQQAPQQDDRMAQLQSMMEKYATPQNDYAQELEEARRKSNAETEAFAEMLKGARKSPERDNMSQAERYFRLAAAFGQPTKTGSFGETLANVNTAMAENEKSKQQSEDQDLELQMKAQMMKAAGAKEELGALRGLAGESMKDRRALISELIKAEIPKAQSEAGKLALDMGYQVGTPDYQKFVTANGMQLLQAKVNQMLMGPAIAAQNAATSGAQLGVAQGNLTENQQRNDLERLKYLDKQKEGEKLTPKELDIKWAKEDTLNNLENAQKMIEQAYDLNDVAYTGNVFDIAKQKYGETFSPEDPTVVNTGKLINLLSTESLSRMKDVFGSNPTEGERAAQAQLSGALAKSKEVRKDIMLNYMEQLQKRIALEKRRLNQLSEGKSRDLPSKEDAQ
jgi:hypothetical protein